MLCIFQGHYDVFFRPCIHFQPRLSSRVAGELEALPGERHAGYTHSRFQYMTKILEQKFTFRNRKHTLVEELCEILLK